MTKRRRIPLFKELLADFETPLSIYLKLANKPNSYLFESVEGGEKWGRYSIIGLPCRERIEVRDKTVTRIRDHVMVEHAEFADPFEYIREFHQQFAVEALPDLPIMTGGLVGYFGFETIGLIEPTLNQNNPDEPVGAADISLMISEEVVVFDNLGGRLFVIVHADPDQADGIEQAEQRLDQITEQLFAALPARPQFVAGAKSEPISYSIEQENFKQAVETCRNHIYEGDAFQIVISQRMSVPFAQHPLDLYRALRTLNPSPYLYYIDYGDFQIAGSSPEVMVRLKDDVITLRPIAGTRKRGRTTEEDIALAEDLLADEKECAEHLMLIDLGRNDVGRVSEIGTVNVTETMIIERYSHVMHIVSNVEGRIKPGYDALDVFKATFPAGTLTGAPKIKAMDIIQGLEPERRGIYSGAVGYLGWDGNMDTAIAIRTALIKDGHVYVQAGAGIVADSVPESEWQETLNKGRAVLDAVAMANGNLQQPLNSGGHDAIND